MKKYYHGTYYNFKEGFKLFPQDDYTSNKKISELEALFERYRPENKISRSKAVFLSDDLALIDAAGGYTEVIYEVEPESVEGSDLAWYTEASHILHEENNDNYDLAIEAAINYWKGIPYHKEEYSCFEYRCKEATVIKIEELNVPKPNLSKPKSKKNKRLRI